MHIVVDIISKTIHMIYTFICTEQKSTSFILKNGIVKGPGVKYIHMNTKIKEFNSLYISFSLDVFTKENMRKSKKLNMKGPFDRFP